MRPHVKRNKTIDFLRGVATLVMIIIHVTAYFLKDKNVYILWDYAHFVVPIFVFCSAFVYFQKDDTKLSVLTIWKRIKRLIVPYYVFVIILFATQYLFKIKMTDHTFVDHLLLRDGRYINWLVVLFISFIFLFPFMGWLRKNMLLLYTFTTLSIFSTLYLFYNDLSNVFRYVMILPWAAVALYGLYLSRMKNKTMFLIAILTISTIVFFLTKWQLLKDLEKPVRFQDIN
jgi:fucose 4-O-acetylase-like acetyltransferase